MRLTISHIVFKSLLYDRKGVIYQVLIIILLTAVITGSLMTGSSVRNSLKSTSLEKTGNTGIMVSSGIRYFDPSLAGRMEAETGIATAGVLEIDGYCQNFSTEEASPSVKIYAVDDNFFRFQGNDTIRINKGEAAINERLASWLRLKPGDDIVIRFSTLSDLPADAPFSPERNVTGSLVIRTGKILSGSESGNFSLGISQITPLNIFIGLSDLTAMIDNFPGINRLLFRDRPDIKVSDIYNSLHKAIVPGDIGLKVRTIPATGGKELVSDRIFIDELIAGEIERLPLGPHPAITYLANSISIHGRSTPYSFVSALDPDLYKGIPDASGIILNRWIAEDLGAQPGDTVTLTYFTPDSRNNLAEARHDFIVSEIVEMKGIWADSLLMPEFPGIAGKESCSSWDAGVAIDMDQIRDKDEEYWNLYRGTPKAFINYEKGKELWGSNYGPVTTIRFEQGINDSLIKSRIAGAIDPYKSGFTITDLPAVSSDAAANSVDFSTLFLGLGFFIILSAVILLILVVSTYLESKRKHITTLFSTGFNNRRIRKILLFETLIIALTGAIPGAIAGVLFNVVVINALNSVWQGAVQTDTLSAGIIPGSLFLGFGASVLLIFIILAMKSSGFLKELNSKRKEQILRKFSKWNLTVSIGLTAITAMAVALSFISSENSTLLSFCAGITAFAAMIFIVRQSYYQREITAVSGFRKAQQISLRYYAFNPWQAVAPVLFLAAGLFAVIITGINRMDINDSMLKRTGGTGGFLLWGESPVPVKGDLNSADVRHDLGLDEPEYKDLVFVQAALTSGNDASCLNLNHITSPPLAGVDASEFAGRGSFSFATRMKGLKKTNPWLTLDNPPDDSTIYGIADQTVLQYGLKIKTGDTLRIRTENGQVVRVVISAGLKSSVFQGFVLTGRKDFNRFFPSVSGSRIFLADGDPALAATYQNTLIERLSEYGARFEPASDRLASFFVVTNTYLTVFTILGGIGMILGVAGLGFILIRNFNQRKREFGLMMATGFSVKKIRRIIFTDHSKILLAGIITGIVSALIATRPSIAGNASIPWLTIGGMIFLILLTGFAALAISLRSVKKDDLITRIRKE